MGSASTVLHWVHENLSKIDEKSLSFCSRRWLYCKDVELQEHFNTDSVFTLAHQKIPSSTPILFIKEFWLPGSGPDFGVPPFSGIIAVILLKILLALQALLETNMIKINQP
ncbi:hypothetical protein IGI04_018516 [Brassica rapa subsp. trilocularis]|uniref:Uncharacterized protein n=1 Tax=Brassica rapa subsp. trilocularis TaxID=1813537 RepID=A0ABQ7MDN2_BRACM|nr:hypothetical protein IGI04_029196 [Brassica rapa subsp. trilocularis]KAG5381355.1 hypothetical protein IGI04_029197 [Brassica rapa subsp. trilocularis]KAG5386097.1 hypothetical protein IGI04_037567 [Brassica rapa subsp. trilocularis]KAG5396702.1 hypothetical protein IGI04_018516 [Brassica rapa subsp. trilocularis]